MEVSQNKGEEKFHLHPPQKRLKIFKVLKNLTSEMPI